MASGLSARQIQMMMGLGGAPHEDPAQERLEAEMSEAVLQRGGADAGWIAKAEELLDRAMAHRPRSALLANDLGLSGLRLALAIDAERGISRDAGESMRRHPREHLMRMGYRKGLEELRRENPAFAAALEGDLEALGKALAGRGAKARAIRPLFRERKGESDDEARQRGEIRYAPLHIACLNDSAEAVDLLMAAGASAGQFVGGVTPSGIAAYTGKARALEAIARNGGDLRLELRPEHSEANAGSTLLHRVLGRKIRNRERIVELLIGSGQYPDPLPRDAQGRSPLTEAEDTGDGAIRWLEGFARAREERSEIGQAAEPSDLQKRRPGL